MTTFASPSWVSHLSRRKLQSVAEDTGDALRRCVLIHNVMRSTASSSHAPTQPAPPQLEPQPTPQPQFVFPSMDYSQEQQWLDSLLDDLESDVQVSVVSVDDRHDASECCTSSSVATPSLSIQRPASPPPTFESLYFSSPDEDEEPSSPPPLEDHDESDDEDNEDSDSEATTPTSSTELLGAAPPNGVPPDYFFNNLPYNRLRPPHFDLFY